MNHVIIGAGPAGVVAAETIRQLDPTAGITLIGNESSKPYSRMAIPYLLEENIGEPGTHLRQSAGHFDAQGIVLKEAHVSAIDSKNQTVAFDDNSAALTWDKLFIATGASPVVPPIPGLDHPRVSNCWTLEDARKIVDHIQPGSRVLQIGAGFIACIILEALVKRGADLTVVEMEDRMVPRMLDVQSGTMLKAWCEREGVTVRTGARVNRIEEDGGALQVQLSEGEPVQVDFVISATGVTPNIGFLDGSGIDTGRGIKVNRFLQTSHPAIYAGGDVAEGLDFSTGEYSVQAIQPTATEHGRIVGKNMVTGNTVEHQGSVAMNVLATLGLVSASYGQWQGVPGGEASVLNDPENFRYIRLQFEGEQLIGANTLGMTQHLGAIRGLIQSKTPLGRWKQRLLENPTDFMAAYVGVTGRHV